MLELIQSESHSVAVTDADLACSAAIPGHISPGCLITASGWFEPHHVLAVDIPGSQHPTLCTATKGTV